MNKFVSKLDQSVFGSEQEAFDHFKNTYLDIHESDETVSEEVDIYKKIKAAFPDAKISLSLASNGWGRYNIKLDFGDVQFDQYLIKNEDGHTSGRKTVESFINLITKTKEMTDYILKEVFVRYNFCEFKFSRYHDDYGNGHYIDFEFTTQLGVEGKKTYQPHQDIETFIEELNQYFINYIEGISEARYDDGYFDDYYVDGIPVGGILNRGKKVKIEIVD